MPRDGGHPHSGPPAFGGRLFRLMSSKFSFKALFKSRLKIAGMILLLAVGPICWYYTFAGAVRRLSYDLPYPLRQRRSTPGVVIIYLDEDSAKALGQQVSGVWDRSLHTQLLNHLTDEGVKAVYYDILFRAQSADPKVDKDFAAAIARNGHVILGNTIEPVLYPGTGVHPGEFMETTYLPTEVLGKAAAATGLLLFKPIDTDYAVRHLYTGNEDLPTASWAAAQMLGAPVTRNPEDRLKPRWMNYYGTPGTITSVSFVRALQKDGVSPGFFKDQVVFIGGLPVVGALTQGKDDFANPWSRFGIHPLLPGVEVHATEFLNLMRGDWLTEMPDGVQLALLLVVGLVMGVIANFLPPVKTLLISAGMMVLITVVTFWLLWYQHIWFDWLVPVGIQIPLGAIWCAGSQYFDESKRRAALKDAFSLYLSPHMADKISKSDFDLTPGGKLVDATIVFTDCKGFTAMSEELNDPMKLSQTLIAYFTQTSKCVLDNDGTIIKYIGDAIMAAWGAPLDEKDHPYKAALAAYQMSEASKNVVLGRLLKTRVGVATGPALAGNLGSPYRFDYTLIGDTTNFASRLEGLNKFANTNILISDSTQKAIGDRFVTRLMGHFMLVGKSHGLPVHELICPSSEPAAEGHRKWAALFAEAMEAIKTGQFEQAKVMLRKTVWERGGEDGPSEFYLKKIAELEKEHTLQEWTGVVKLTEK
jgi:adenylate cyclase